MIKVPNEKYVSVFSADDEYTANIIKSVLEDEEIKVIIAPRNDSLAFDGVIALAEGYWGDVMVPESQADKAIEILKIYSAGDNNEPNDA